MVDDAHRRWVAEMPLAYDRFLAPTVFQPFAVDLGRRVRSHRPRRVLELAAGTGVLTRELVADGVEVIATDLNVSMVDLGRRNVPEATWREADAMALPFGDEEFDVVACQFGVMFLPDKPAAFAEARRVLAPNGVLVASTWGTLAEHEFEAVVVEAVTRAFPDDPPTFLADVPHGYADPDRVLADARAGGFADVTVETVTVTGRASSAADLATGYCHGTPMRAGLEARGDLAATTATLAAELTNRFGAGEVQGRMTAHVVTASRAM